MHMIVTSIQNLKAVLITRGYVRRTIKLSIPLQMRKSNAIYTRSNGKQNLRSATEIKKKKKKIKMVIRNHVDEDGTTTHRKKLRHNHEDYALFDRLVFHWRRQYIALFHGVLLFF